MTNQLRLRGIRKRFADRYVVDRLDLEVAKGEFVALLGPSGCGKTTTLRMIAGLEKTDQGEIEIAGEIVVSGKRFLPTERRRVGLVFQEYALFPHLTVGQNIAYGISRRARRSESVDAHLSMVGLGGLSERYPRELSGGQQQRVALARALAPQPDLLLLDEPFSNLDPALRGQIRADVRQILRRSGTTSILVTHDQEEALSMADRIAVMFDGRIAQCDTATTLYERPVSREVASFVGDAQFLPGRGSGKTIDTKLGPLRTVAEIDGSVEALIRPEMVVLLPTDSPFGVKGRVADSRFFGHDQLLALTLADGSRIESRAIGTSKFTPGDEVRLTVRGPVLTFPVKSS